MRLALPLAATALLSAAATALVLGAGDDRGEAPAGARDAAGGSQAPSTPAIAALRDRIDLEAASRMELAVRMESLAAEIVALREALTTGREADRSAGRVPPAPEATASSRRPVPRGAPGRIDPDALVDAGFERERVERLKRRVDALDLARLELRDRATREGWIGSPRFFEERRDLGRGLDGLREEVEPALYDWLLYSTGRPNRVVVDEVMDGSAAAAAGLAPGDVVRRYDVDPVYRPGELRDATTLGSAGETVAVEVERDGSRLRVFVPRGPLGVRVRTAAAEPPPAEAAR